MEKTVYIIGGFVLFVVWFIYFWSPLFSRFVLLPSRAWLKSRFHISSIPDRWTRRKTLILHLESKRPLSFGEFIFVHGFYYGTESIRIFPLILFSLLILFHRVDIIAYSMVGVAAIQLIFWLHRGNSQEALQEKLVQQILYIKDSEAAARLKQGGGFILFWNDIQLNMHSIRKTSQKLADVGRYKLLFDQFHDFFMLADGLQRQISREESEKYFKKMDVFLKKLESIHP